MAQDLITDLQIKITKLEARNKALERENTEIKNQNAMASSSNGADSTKLQKVNEEKDKQIMDLKNQINTLSVNADQSELAEELQKKNDALKIELEKYSAQSGQSSAADIESVKNDYKMKLEEKEQQVVSLQKQVNELTQKVKQSSVPTGDLIQDLNRKIQRLTGINKKQKAQLAQFESLKDSQKIISDLENKILKVSQDIQMRDQTIRQQKEDINSLNTKIQVLQSNDRLSILQKQLEAKENVMFSLEGETKALRNKVEIQNKTIEQLNSKIVELTKDDLQAEIDKKQNTIILLKEKVNNLESELESQKEEFAKIKAKNLNLLDTLNSSDTERRLNDEIQKNQKLTTDIEARLIQIKTLNDKIKERDLKISQLETLGAHDAAKRLEKHNIELQEQIENYQQRLELSQERVRNLEQEIEEAGTKQQQMRIRELRSMLNEFKKRQRQSQSEINHWKQKALEQSDSFF